MLPDLGTNLLITSAILWLLVVAFYFIKNRHWKFFKFSFSVNNYHLMISAIAGALVLYAIQVNSWRPILIFAVFATAGMIGETLFSVWWRFFFKRRFWSYREETIYHKYTSLLNIIPWGVGGFMYSLAAQIFESQKGEGFYAGTEYVFMVSFAIALFMQISFFYLLISQRTQTRAKFFEKATAANILFFYFPILFSVFTIASIYGSSILIMALLFGFLAASAEYLFGKIAEFFVSKKLWTYNYSPMDNGHFTPLSILPFILGGFYFWSIAKIILLYL